MPKKFRAKFAGNGVQIDGKPVDSPKGTGLLNKTPKADNVVPSVSCCDMEDLGLLNNLGDDMVPTNTLDDDSGEVVGEQPSRSAPSDGYYTKQSHNHKNSIAESTTGDLTMEQLFESYVEENDEVDHAGFADYSTQNDYEVPSEEDTLDLMKANQSFIFTPTGDGKYTKTVVSGGDTVAPAAAAPASSGSFDNIGIDDVSVDDLPPPPSQSAGGGMSSDLSVTVSDMPGADGDDYGYGEDEDDEIGTEEVEEEYSEDGDCDQSGGYDNNDDCDESVEESLTTAGIASAPSMSPKIKKGKVQKAGNAATAVKGLKNHGKTLDRKIKNDTVSESFKLPAQIAKNVAAIIEHVEKQFAKIPSYKKMDRSFNVVVESNGKYLKTGSTKFIIEAAADAEEIAVIGKGNAFIEVNLFEGKRHSGMFLVEMPKLNDRKPHLVKEGVILRFPSIAKRISKQFIGESVVHSIKNHPYGVIIKGDVEKIADSINKIV
jgi:hypothetical protein